MKVNISCSAADDNSTPTSQRSKFQPPRRLLTTAVIGAALIGYLVQKTPDARQRLESLASVALDSGDLSRNDAKLVAELLAKPYLNTSTGKHHA